MTNEKPWYLNDSELSQGYEKFVEESQGAFLDPKTQELLKLVCASIFRCHRCTQIHLKKSLAVGASKDEIKEALLISSEMAAATQLNWDHEDFEKYLGE
jgi:AhpD family alkylhydroperoxidase